MRTSILIIFLTALFSVAGSVCYAQSSAPQGTPMRSDWRPGVRYTTGSYTVRGWEKQLVGGNPNLGHWNWSPVVGYTQSVATGTSKQTNTAPMPERKSVYIKPNHVPLPVVVHSTAKQAIAQALPKAPSVTPDVSEGSSSNRTETHTQAILSYGSDYRGNDSYRAASSVRGSLAHRSVGAILSQSLHY
jgi:hypothetical protein